MIVQRAVIKDRLPQTIQLPMPPGSSQPGATSSENLARWCEAASRMLIEQRPRRYLSPVEIEIVFAKPKRHAEIETRIAPVLGLLVQHGVIPTSDSTVLKKISASWGDVGKCELTFRSAA
jgi:hypothetical protein